MSRNGREPFGTVYVDKEGCEIFVGVGLGGKSWFTYKDDMSKTRGPKRMKSPGLPIRDTPEVAQEDLDKYAQAKGYPAKS